MTANCPTCGQRLPPTRMTPMTASPPYVLTEPTQELHHTRSCPLHWEAHWVNGSNCTCGLEYRIQLQTEREMHNAWRKRAEEAEAMLSARPESASKLQQAQEDARMQLENVVAASDRLYAQVRAMPDHHPQAFTELANLTEEREITWARSALASLSAAEGGNT